MSNARKLQTEIDRVMKKVDEGVELFDEIWGKVYSAEQQNQKEKYEIDLKKEIKKLQRLRDQIKTWIGSSDVKDKDSLIDARKLIETKMEQFKICEKETKTKTYSKEGLARAEKLSPEEQAKEDTCKWIAAIIEQLQQLVEDRDVEIERLSAGKGKKTNKHIIEEYNDIIISHKFHINKLEGIMRLVMNDRLEPDIVNELREDLEYYIEAHEDEEYMQSYDEEIFYDALGLDEMDIVNVDRVTQTPSVSKLSKSDDTSTNSGNLSEKKSKLKKSSSSTGVIPLTIGRARVNNSLVKSKDDFKDATTPTKKTLSNSVPLTLGSSPTSRLSPTVSVNSGTSMAAILKRESDHQEKERQKQVAIQQHRLLQEQHARVQTEQLRQQQLQRQQHEHLRQQESLRQQQDALKRQQQHKIQEQQRQQKVSQHDMTAKQQQYQHLNRSQKHISSTNPGVALENLLTSGLGGLSLGSIESNTLNSSPAVTISPQQQLGSGIVGSPMSNVNFDATASYLGALNESYLHCPSYADSERQRVYTPRNPYPTPSSYPSIPSSVFDHALIFEKLGTDCLFFIFYYGQGSYQQYLAAKELKKRSWRYHKKYMTWFQRHEEPKITTDEYEQGTYVYFDYETGWCQRIKSDFRFEYSFLEDSLSI